jgi:hypothetical protein
MGLLNEFTDSDDGHNSVSFMHLFVWLSCYLDEII